MREAGLKPIALELWLEEVNTETVPTEDEERALLERATQGDLQARDELIRRNRRLVLYWAAKYVQRGRYQVPLEDLIQAGCIGLWKALERFDPRRQTRFSTYASFWIRQALQRAHHEQSGIIRLPAHIHERLRREAQGLPVQNPALVEQARRVSQPPLSLLSPPRHMEENGDDSEMREGLIGWDREEERLENLALREILETAIALLPEREEKVIRLLYGFNDGVTRTLAETGRKLGISRERVRQLRDKALETLREILSQYQEAL